MKAKPRLRLSAQCPVVGNLWQRTPWGERYVGYFWQGKFWELYPGVME